MMLWVVLIGSIALLINMMFYFLEIEDIGRAVKALFKGTGSMKQVWEAIWLFLKDAIVTALVVGMAGTGLQSFLIGSVGGVLVSVVLCWKQIGAWMDSHLNGDKAKIITDLGNGQQKLELVPVVSDEG